MEHLKISKTDTGIHIDGFPDAVNIIQIKGPRSKRLADLDLHKGDMEFAAQCLEAINQVPDKPWVIKQALWRSAIIHFIKCFGNSEPRSQLSADKIYMGNASALDVYNFFKVLRNKHFIHDENSYAQSIPGAILNNGGKSYKVEKLFVLAELLRPSNRKITVI